jgi:hypothetical protein
MPHGLTPLVAAFHVHSTVSTGALGLDELAEQAERLGLDAVILTDNFVLRYEYGLFPLRGAVRRVFSLPSVLDYGVERYFADLAAAQARHPNVLLVPGIEVVPHYFWTGSLLARDLTMHNSQKNVLVFGLSHPDDMAAVPVTGNPSSYRYGWGSLMNLTPGLLLVPAAWLWQRRTYRTMLVGVTAYRVTKRHRASAVIVGGTGGLLLLAAWPFGQPVFSIYDEQLGYRPYQAFIDTVAARGGLVVWSMPEAPDFNQYSFGPLGNVTVKTDPYPEALLQTFGYTGFGGLYQQPRTVTQPGGVWDQALGQYLGGQRAEPPFAFGEIAFHRSGSAGIELNQVLTVFWVEERTIAGVVEAMRKGRFYATGPGLRLDTFRVECAGGARRASSGETLDPAENHDVTVHVSISATDRGEHPVTVTVIRSGQVVAKYDGVTPFTQQFMDTAVPPGAWNFYRVEVQGSGELMSNPIFVNPETAISSQPSGISLDDGKSVSPKLTAKG